MGIMVYSLLWVMQDLYHPPYVICGFLSCGLEEVCFAKGLSPRWREVKEQPEHPNTPKYAGA